MDSPAAEDRMAVLETSELPGRASRTDCAFFLGSSAGTLDDCRWPAAAREVMAGRVRVEMEGRRRAAPAPVARVSRPIAQCYAIIIVGHGTTHRERI